ncbi:MAG TPA: hypothetical protein VMZ91_14975 [Candidatus Paceibacterota bacterium]|nr:hypothetical protein [Candidatus Paceibacterota bacterium]
MNIELEVKEIIRRVSLTPEERAEKICSFTNFKKEDVISAIKKGGKTPSDIYGTLINLWEKSQ